MSTSVKESILANIKTALQAISIANGYNNDIAGGVQRYKQTGNDLAVLPTIIIIQGPEKKDPKAGYDRTNVHLSVFILVWARDAEGGADTDTVVNSLVLDIEKALMADESRGGNAVDTNVTDVEPLDSDEGQPFCGAILEVDIHFRHLVTDPATKR